MIHTLAANPIVSFNKYLTPVTVQRLKMTLCALLCMIILSVILADIFLSMALYDHLLLLGMEWYDATSVTVVFSSFFFILLVALLIIIEAPASTPGSRPTTPPQASPSSFPCTSPSISDSPPPSYRLLMEVEEGELPSYEEATK